MCLDPESQGPEGCHQVTGALGRVSLLPTPTGSFPAPFLGTLPPIPPRRRPFPHHRRSGFGIRDRMWPEAVGRIEHRLPGCPGAPVSPWKGLERCGPGGSAPRASPRLPRAARGVPHPPGQGGSGFRRPGGAGAGRGAAPSQEAHSEGGWESGRRVPLAGSRGLSRQPAQSAPPDGRGPALRGRFLFVSIPSSSPFNLLQTPS